MPEEYRRPYCHEANRRTERMRAAGRAERETLATVRVFNARLSAGRAVWFWPKITAASVTLVLGSTKFQYDLANS